jgi:hypothetical protein
MARQKWQPRGESASTFIMYHLCAYTSKPPAKRRSKTPCGAALLVLALPDRGSVRTIDPEQQVRWQQADE